MALLGILMMIAVPKVSIYIEDAKVDKANNLAVLLNSNIQREFVDLNGLVLDIDNVNGPNSKIKQDIQSNENLQDDVIVEFYSAGYDETTAVNSLLNSKINSSLPTDYVGVILPDNNATALFSKTPTLNLNKPIKLIIKFSNNDTAFVYENGVNVTEKYIPTYQP